jgi:SAM-dependent methyltransferase
MARTSDALPIPPPEYRYLIGPSRVEAFDNPGGDPIIPEVPPDAYESVFEFGSGCGRFARQLLQQQPRPRRYVGTDVHRGMIQWCADNLTPIDPSFQFRHHDVFSAVYGPDNSRRLAEPFPAGSGEFSLVLAHSVFTHLYKDQAAYYLSEVARVLRPDGLAYTTWLLFDRASFPFLTPDKACLYVDELDPTAAVIYDRGWLLGAIRRCGLAVRRTVPPAVPGHQWLVLLERRRPGAVDRFPLGADAAEWVCGATAKPAARVELSDGEREVVLRAHDPALGPMVVPPGEPARPLAPPFTFGPMEPVLEAEIAALKRSWTWRVGRFFVAPAGWLKRLVKPR